MMDIKDAYKDAKRLKQIVTALFQSGLGHYIYEMKLSHHLLWHQKTEKIERPEDLTRRIRIALDQLGGTFVKLGQLLSLRPDLIPQEYCDEFAKLQDNVSSFPYDKAKEIVESELKHKLEDVFSYFDKEPIASASIGQVHKARLRNGARVVIKVQRPGISELMQTDVDLLYHLAGLMEKHIKEVQGYNLKALVDEFKRYTLNELDYLKEGRNIERFYKNFKDDATVKIPKLYPDYSSSRVLTMSYIDGIPVDDKDGFKDWGCDEEIISKNLVNFFLKQYLEYGFFHADPHPANVFVLPGNKIALLDFGICGSLTEGMKEKLVDMLVSLVDRDINTFVDGFFEVGMIDEKDETLVNDIEAIVEEYAGANIDQIDFVHLFNDLVFTARRHNIFLPVDFILLAKAIITIEGVGQQLNPEFNLSSALHDYTDTITARRLRPSYIIKNFIEGISDFRDNVKLVPRQINEILLKLKRGELGVHFERKDLVQ